MYGRKMIIGIGMITGLILLSGCGGVSSSLSINDKSVYKGKKVILIEKDTLIRPGVKAPQGPYIDLNIASAIIQKQINDSTSGPVYARPTHEIANKTMSLLSKRFGMIRVKNTGQKNLNYDYTLEIKTNWWIDQFMLSNGYLVMNNDIKLIDKKTKKVIANAYCSYGQEKREMSPESRKTIFSNNGKIIKREARKAIQKCMKKIRSQIFVEPGKAKSITDEPSFMYRPLI